MSSTKPEEPTEEDCCHSGCSTCVFDIYSIALKNWESNQCTNKQCRSDLLSLTRFKPFWLYTIKKITFNTYLFVLKPQIEINESIRGFLSYNAGQHLSLRIDKINLGKVTQEFIEHPYFIRNFTIISLSQENDDFSFKVLIKLYENSETSNFIKKLQVGDVTYWRGPYGEYKYYPNKYSHLIMLCMGTGIAPMYPIIKEIVNNEKDETIIKLLYGCKNFSEIILRKELGELSSYWNFNCVYYLSEEHQLQNKKYNEEFVLSRISYEHISDVILNKRNCFFLICGSSNFANDMRQNLEILNISDTMMNIF